MHGDINFESFDYVSPKKHSKMGHFDGKGTPNMTNEILLHLTTRSSSRLLHYIVVIKREVSTK